MVLEPKITHPAVDPMVLTKYFPLFGLSASFKNYFSFLSVVVSTIILAYLMLFRPYGRPSGDTKTSKFYCIVFHGTTVKI